MVNFGLITKMQHVCVYSTLALYLKPELQLVPTFHIRYELVSMYLLTGITKAFILNNDMK